MNAHDVFGSAYGFARREFVLAEQRRAWASLPADFERDAVKHLFATLRPHMAKAAIKQRISASHAATFRDFGRALSLCD